MEKKETFQPTIQSDSVQLLTKREYFAAMAMQGILANQSIDFDRIEVGDKGIATVSILLADELLTQLSNEK